MLPATLWGGWEDGRKDTQRPVRCLNPGHSVADPLDIREAGGGGVSALSFPQAGPWVIAEGFKGERD